MGNFNNKVVIFSSNPALGMFIVFLIKRNKAAFQNSHFNV
jgi:hypothetical protein